MDLSNLLADNSSEKSVTVKVKPSSKLPKDLGDMMDRGSSPAMPPKMWAPEPENPIISELKRFGGTAIGLPFLIYYLLKEGALSSPSTPQPAPAPYSGMPNDNLFRSH
jgi:hypothetical protein